MSDSNEPSAPKDSLEDALNASAVFSVAPASEKEPLNQANAPEKEPSNEANAPASDNTNPESSKASSCWDGILVKILLIFLFLGICGVATVNVMYFLKWHATENDMIIAKNELANASKVWKNWNTTCEKYTKDVKEKKEEIVKERDKLAQLKKQTGNLTEIQYKLQNQTVDLNKKLNETIAERDAIVKENEEHKKANQALEEQLKHLNTELTETKHRLNLTEQEMSTYKIIALSTGGVVAVDALLDLLGHYWQFAAEEAYKNIYPYAVGFNALCEAFENLIIIEKYTNKKVVRTTCFNTTSSRTTENCTDKFPTITAIEAEKGYRFGAVFFEKWPNIHTSGIYQDSKAYAFSSNHAAVAEIGDPTKALYVNDTTLVHFGETDIVVTKDPREVTAVGKTYNVPSPYTPQSFFFNGTKLVATSVQVDVVSLQ